MYSTYNSQGFSSMPVSAAQHNFVTNQRIQLFNDELYQSTGYRQEEMAYQHPLHTLPPYKAISTEQTMPLHDGRKSKSINSKEIPLAVLSRRRAQNRASQRAYRNRKDTYIRNLETHLSEMKGRYEKLSAEHERCSAGYKKIRERIHEEVRENWKLKDGQGDGCLSCKSLVNGSQEQFMGSSDEDERFGEEFLGFER